MFDVCVVPWVERGQEWLQEFGQAARTVEFPPTKKGKAAGGTGQVRDIRSFSLTLAHFEMCATPSRDVE